MMSYFLFIFLAIGVCGKNDSRVHHETASNTEEVELTNFYEGSGNFEVILNETGSGDEHLSQEEHKSASMFIILRNTTADKTVPTASSTAEQFIMNEEFLSVSIAETDRLLDGNTTVDGSVSMLNEETTAVNIGNSDQTTTLEELVTTFATGTTAVKSERYEETTTVGDLVVNVTGIGSEGRGEITIINTTTTTTTTTAVENEASSTLADKLVTTAGIDTVARSDNGGEHATTMVKIELETTEKPGGVEVSTAIDELAMSTISEAMTDETTVILLSTTTEQAPTPFVTGNSKTTQRPSTSMTSSMEPQMEPLNSSATGPGFSKLVNFLVPLFILFSLL